MKATIDIDFTSAPGCRPNGSSVSEAPLFYTADGVDGQVIVSGCNREDFDHAKIILEGELRECSSFDIQLTLVLRYYIHRYKACRLLPVATIPISCTTTGGLTIRTFTQGLQY